MIYVRYMGSHAIKINQSTKVKIKIPNMTKNM